MSPAPAACAADAAASPPFAARASAAFGTRSKPATRWPAPTRLAAIGAPILPSPINPIVAIAGLLRGSRRSRETRLAQSGREFELRFTSRIGGTQSPQHL